MSKLKWYDAGGTTPWEPGMLVADVELSKDETLFLYKHRDAPEPTAEMLGFTTPSLTWLVEARKRMEQSIFNATVKAVYDFQRETGLTPCDITIDLRSIEAFGQPPYRLVNAVKARAEL